MPLVATSGLPTFARLRADGEEVLDVERAVHQDIRELHIGLLNLMPDAAVQATERQFLRLVGACNRIVQFYVHPFTIDGVPRAGETAAHVARYYEHFTDVERDGLDALIITGANPQTDDITEESFWEPLIAVMNWARVHVCSTIMSCLASHAAFKHYHGVERERLPAKRWGVYSHRVKDLAHPLVGDINTRFDTCHSRLNDVPGTRIEAAGMHVLVQSDQAGVLMAVSPDGLRFVYLQGHPEYDIVSLLKEYKREVALFAAGERADYPPYPDHYFSPRATGLLDAYRGEVESARRRGWPMPEFPEAQVAPMLDNTWTDTGKAVFNNWLGLVYQLTHPDRKIAYMERVDPDDPLGLRAG